MLTIIVNYIILFALLILEPSMYFVKGLLYFGIKPKLSHSMYVLEYFGFTRITKNPVRHNLVEKAVMGI